MCVEGRIQTLKLSVVLTVLLSVFAVVTVAAPHPSLAQGENLLNNDKALLHFVMPNNWEFGRVLGPCVHLKLSRSVNNGRHRFSIRGWCRIRNALAPDEDCYGYSLVADGTVDTPENATVRKMTLRLLCSA